MSKHNKTKLEKAERNKIQADRFKKTDEDGKKKSRRGTSRYTNWCRTEGHPPECSHNLPTREEVLAVTIKRARSSAE